MGDKSSDRGVKMFVARVDDPIWLGEKARQMATELLEKEKKPIGDKIEAAAYRLQNRHGVEVAPVILQCWNREPREMKVSRWMSLFYVYWKECGAKIEAAYEEERGRHDGNTALVRLADFVAGKEVEREMK